MSSARPSLTDELAPFLVGLEPHSDKWIEAYVDAWANTEEGSAWLNDPSNMTALTEQATHPGSIEDSIAGTVASTDIGSSVNLTLTPEPSLAKVTKAAKQFKLQIAAYLRLVKPGQPQIPFVQGCAGILDDLRKVHVSTTAQMAQRRIACEGIVRAISSRLIHPNYRNPSPAIIRSSWGQFLGSGASNLRALLARCSEGLDEVGIEEHLPIIERLATLANHCHEAIPPYDRLAEPSAP